MTSKFQQAIVLNVEHKKRHQELYDKMCSAKRDSGDSHKYSCEIMRESTRHHEALRGLGYRHRDVDMDGLGPIKDWHAEPDGSRHWLIRITKAWLEHRKRRRMLRDAAHGLRTNFTTVKDWKRAFPNSELLKSFAGTDDENWAKADRIDGFCNMEVDDFEREWKRLGLNRDIFNIQKIWKKGKDA